MNDFQKFIKRTFDVIFSLFGLFILFIPGLCIGIAIKSSSRGPVLFNQIRVGKRGEPFHCIKFRTMVINAEQLGMITTSIDPRIFPFGGILRKFKIDEFPQLWNVFIGKMSFVGPRPDVPGYANALTGEARKILELQPGITGPASLYFRNEEELLANVKNPKVFNDTVLWPKKVELNLDYYKHWSFWKDIGYILLTIFPALERICHLIPPADHNAENISV